MKLKKHNYVAIAAIVLYCFASYKSFSYKRFTVLLVVITSLFSSYFYSQQVTISGLENIHISEGASIVAEHTDNKITVITSSSTKSYTQEEKSLIAKKDVYQNKKKVYKKENIAKKSKSNSLKKFENIKNFAIFTNTDSESSSSFEIANILQKQCTNRSNNGNESLLKPENIWKIALINYQTKDNILYLYYHSKKANDSLFARPPPIII